MIRAERLSLDSATFAAERKDILTRTEDKIREMVRTSLIRFGLPRWADNIVEAALDVFDTTVAYETEEPSQVIDDMRGAFEEELRRTLELTKRGDSIDKQTETITRWIAVMAVNAGTEASTSADPDTNVGLQWVTMGDGDVRESHREANGQTVPTGSPFSVDGQEVYYPGQPVGDPSVWINCRCVAAPTMLTQLSGDRQEFAASTEFANASDPDEQDAPEAAVVVLLPREGDPVTQMASGDYPHETLLYLGDGTMDLAPLVAEVEAYAGLVGHLITDKVSGRAVLGKDSADVLLLDATGSSIVREGLMQSVDVQKWLEMQEQFPTWIPHLTLGYPEAPAAEGDIPEDITFDRIAVWRGSEKYEFLLDGNLETEESEPMPEEDAVVAAASEREIPAGEPGTEDEPTTEDLAALDAESYPEVPFHALLAPEGKPSGDGRQFAVEALTHRDLPLPIKFMWEDAEGHKGSYPVAKMTRIVRHNGAVWAEGVFDTSPQAYEAVRVVANEIMRGISVDVDQVVASMENEDLMEFAAARIASATICAIPAFAEAFIALGPLPAEITGDVSRETQEAAMQIVVDQLDAEFAAAPGLKKDGTPPKCNYCEATATQYVKHSEGMAFVPACDDHIDDAITDAEESVPGGEPDPSNVDNVGQYGIEKFDIPPRKTKDGPGWITEPKPTKRITSYWVDGPGAAKIQWGVPGDFNRCRTNLAKYVQNPDWLAGLCANLHYRALGVWPGQASGKAVEMTDSNALTASVALADTEQDALPADWFRNPQLDGPTPFTVTEDGRVFGHVATWDVCHIGVGDACVTAPPSKTNYAYFLTGEVFTDIGPVAVGQITMGGGHADLRMGLRPALAHYDETGSAVADVTVGEDVFGIWVAGALREGLSKQQIRELRGGALSGDWRKVRVGGTSNLEMVAALAVNVPGFPIPRASLAASGVEQTALVAASIPQRTDADIDLDARIDAAFARRERIAKAEAVKARMRKFRATQAKAKFNLRKEG